MDEVKSQQFRIDKFVIPCQQSGLYSSLFAADKVRGQKMNQFPFARLSLPKRIIIYILRWLIG